MLATVEEMLECVGVDAGGVVAEELTHNRWLSPGVWRVRTSDGQLAVLKYTRSDRNRGTTPREAHWTARDHDPRRWTYWCREPLAYQHDLAGAYAGTGITAPACLGVHIDGVRRYCCWNGRRANLARTGRRHRTERRPKRSAGPRHPSSPGGLFPQPRG